MSMRWMKLEAQTSVPSLYFLLFSRNKVKVVFFCLFPDLSVQYKNIPKIKVLRMPCQFNMIFREYVRIYCAKITAGGAATWPRGWWARPPYRVRPLPRGPTVALLHLSFHPHTPSSSPKHEYPAQA